MILSGDMKIISIFGTRPEAIKLAPVILKLRERKEISCRVCVTAQHREMLDQALQPFGIQPDMDLDLMQSGQNLFDLSSRILLGLQTVLTREKPDFVLVHGDTTTAFMAALSAFYLKIPVAHIEAGLRSFDLKSPFPEEANRVLISKLATLHFAPTPQTKKNLLLEGVDKKKIFVTGNTVIDALLWTKKNLGSVPEKKWKDVFGSAYAAISNSKIEMGLITCHRRENFGEGIKNICSALLEVSELFPNMHWIFPVHPNPNIENTVFARLKNKKNIHLLPPLNYQAFVKAMDRAQIILTDSGGIQEEAPSLGKPVLVLREETERMEALRSGTIKIIGNNAKKIVKEVCRLLEDKKGYKKAASISNPYGDGHAAERIVNFILKTRTR
ncbi:MAG: wecB [Bacteriovoracaceae bacterium]|nr:wecB [Bacteriovoracaceae bacterium]